MLLIMDDARKNPVSFLQELFAHDPIKPQYKLIYNGAAERPAKYMYRLTCGEFTVESDFAPSKQKAKQIAVNKMLEILVRQPTYAGCGIDHYINASELKINNQLHSAASMYNFEPNHVGRLLDLCTSKKLKPSYEYFRGNDSGLYTVVCKVLDIVKRATSITKKQAKHLVASAMYDHIKNANIDLTSRGDNAHDVNRIVVACKNNGTIKPKLSTNLEGFRDGLNGQYIFSPTLNMFLTSSKRFDFLSNIDVSVLDVFKTIMNELKVNFTIKNEGKIKQTIFITLVMETEPELTGRGRHSEFKNAVNIAILDAIQLLCMCYSKL